MMNILQVLLGLALVNYFMFDVVPVEAKPTARPATGNNTAGVGAMSKVVLPARLKTAFMLAGITAVAFLLTLVSSALFEQYVLLRFTHTFLSILFFVVMLAGVLQFIIPIVLTRYLQFGTIPAVLLPLIFVNCVVIGVTMPLRTNGIELSEILLSGCARCAGFVLIMVLFTVARERLTGADIPAAFRGAPATLFAAALVSMTFMGFAGLA